MMRAVLKMAEFRATALGTSSRPTSSTTKAWRAGMSTALRMPLMNASSMICQTAMRLVTTSTNSSRLMPMAMAWVTISVGRRGSRSVMTPPSRPSTITGRNCAAATTPSMNGSWVSWRTSQLWATATIHVPTRLMAWPLKNSR